MRRLLILEKVLPGIYTIHIPLNPRGQAGQNLHSHTIMIYWIDLGGKFQIYAPKLKQSLSTIDASGQ